MMNCVPYIDLGIMLIDDNDYNKGIVNNIAIVIIPKKGKHYYYSTKQADDKDELTLGNSKLLKYRIQADTNCVYAGKFVREVYQDGISWAAFQKYSAGHQAQEVLVEMSKTIFYEVFQDGTECIQLKMAKKLEVVREAQENRYYYVTDFTEVVDKDTDREKYYTIHPQTRYVGQHTGSRMDGWGKDMRMWSHFMNKGHEVIVVHTNTTAFYHVDIASSHDFSDSRGIISQEPVKTCMACKQPDHRIHTCGHENKRQLYFDNQSSQKELLVVRSPVEGKYYEATFWTRKEGLWPIKEKYYTTNTIDQREYAGKFLRTRSEGGGDGGDHWAVFMRDGKEIEIEYDYDGKRAFYEVLSED
jgi:hypothetical protein